MFGMKRNGRTLGLVRWHAQSTALSILDMAIQKSPSNDPPLPKSLAWGAGAWVLDTSSGQPLWRQLHAHLVRLLEQAHWAAGEGLPSERDLAEALGVSRITVKRTYDELRRDGWLGRGSGRGGSVVQARVTQVHAPLGKLKGFTQEMRELGKTAGTRILTRAVVRDRMIASVFGRPSTAPFLQLVRLRSGDDVPMTRECAWYDLTLAPQMADWDGQGSAYDVLRQQCGLILSGATQSVEAVLSTLQEAQDFGLNEPLPCLLFKRKTMSGPSPELVEYVEGLFRGDVYVYQMALAV